MNDIKKTGAMLLIALLAIYSCKKDPAGHQTTDNTNTVPPTTGNTPETIVKGTDPDNTLTQGFFLDDSWQAKTFVAPTTQDVTKPPVSSITVSIDLSKIITKVSPYLFGNNTNPFMGQFVDQPVLMSNLTTLSPN